VAALIALGGSFDLDHLGAQVAEQHGGEGPGQHTGQVEHAEAVKRAFR